MIAWQRVWSVAVVAFAVALLTGCGGGDGATDTGNRRFRLLEFALTTPKTTYAHGEKVPMTFTVKNTGSQTVTVIGGGCVILFRITKGGQSFEPGIGCGAGAYTITFAPGETKIYDLAWDQNDNQGTLVQAGQDTITAWLTAGNIDGTMLSAAEAEQNLSASPIQILVVP